VIATALILSLAVYVLQPFQEDNIKIEKMQYILNAAGIENDVKNVIKLYNEHIINELDLNNEEVERTENGDLKVYICKNGNDTLTIVPISGKGLWGPVWGYIAFEKDLNTIHGAVFDHKGETPGLGAEIAEKKFQSEFIGKKIFDQNGKFVSVSILKRNDNSALEINKVDAISGGTLTSKGLHAAIKESLMKYASYFNNRSVKNEVDEVNEIDKTDEIDGSTTITTKPLTYYSAPFYPYKTGKKVNTTDADSSLNHLQNEQN
jgi:Na+-transporting NADH:ubiquinone oxidoreductase subunit C